MASRNHLNHFVHGANYVASHGGDVPVLRLLLGLVLVGFFFIGLILQIQTSEAFILRGPMVGLTPNWSTLLQPYLLAKGEPSPQMAMAVMWGWGIELTYLVVVVGGATIKGSANKWFKSCAWALVAFNFWADFNYGSLPSGWGGNVGFAAITSFTVAFFGAYGLKLIWGALLEMTQ
jgi:hypothetical protein